MKRFTSHIISLLLVFLWTSKESYAQVLPDPSWGIYQVTVESIHSYTVTGDQLMSSPSHFVWTVSGGTLYTDASATTMAGDGSSVQILGEAGNVSTLYVKWDSSAGEGYVYVYEISSFACQQASSNQNKYVGVRVNKNAKPEVQFIATQSDYCSDDGATILEMKLSGLAPYTVSYRENGGELITITINESDLQDLDSDGNVDDYGLNVAGWTGISSDQNNVFMIESITSDGVEGIIGTNASHTVRVHPLPTISNLQLN